MVKWKNSHQKKISSNQLFSNFFSKDIAFMKVLQKNVRVNFCNCHTVLLLRTVQLCFYFTWNQFQLYFYSLYACKILNFLREIICCCYNTAPLYFSFCLKSISDLLKDTLFSCWLKLFVPAAILSFCMTFLREIKMASENSSKWWLASLPILWNKLIRIHG